MRFFLLGLLLFQYMVNILVNIMLVYRHFNYFSSFEVIVGNAYVYISNYTNTIVSGEYKNCIKFYKSHLP